MGTKDAKIDLAPLTDAYDILGELAGRESAQRMLATRKSDGRPVLIVIQREPREDQGNALSHLASDARLLQEASHPNLVPVLDSQWLGHEAVAIVTERAAHPSLADLLIRREEEFPFPRIGALLREINSALAWARERGIVHRTLRPEDVFVEEGSDRAKLQFSVHPLQANGIPDEHDDSRTVAAIARAMLTRSVADPERDSLPLAELRPGLPSRVVQQAESLLGRADSIEPVDVRAFIAAIAMAEELKQGEDEYRRIAAEMSEEQRITREQLAAERKAHEEDLAAQAGKFAREREEMLKAMAREREDAAREVARERQAGEKQLAGERERFEKEMRRQRAMLEKEQSRLERERRAFDREREKARALIAERVAAIQTHEKLYASTSEIPAPIPAALAAPLPDPELELAADADAERERDFGLETEVAREVEPAADLPHARARERERGAHWLPRAWNRLRGSRGAVGLAVGVLMLVLAVAALATGNRGRPEAVARATTAPQYQVVDSLAGVTVSVVEPESLVSVPAMPVAPAPRRAPAEASVAPARREPVQRDTAAAIMDPFFMPIPPPPADTPARRDTQPRDTSRRDALPVVRRDSVPRRDTFMLPRRDSIIPPPADTLGAAA